MTPKLIELVRADEAASLWKSVLHMLSPRLSAATRDSLVQHSRCLERSATELRVAVDSSCLDVCLRNGQALEASLANLTDDGLALALVPVDDLASQHTDPTYSFASFVTSPANATARAKALASTRSGSAGALVFHGPVGSGKTHLLRAIANAFLEARRLERVLCCTGEQLSLDLIRAIGGDSIEEFRADIRSVDALIVDDVDALAGRDATQEELALSLEALGKRGVPIALSSSKPIERLSGIVGPLREQLARFAEIELRAPEWETRIAIVLSHAHGWRAEPTAAVAAFLATRLRTNLGKLDAVLTRLMTRSSSANALTDLEVVKHLLAASSEKPLSTSPNDVLTAVSRHFNLRIRELRSSSRSARVTTPRQVAMYLMRRVCGLSYPEIGRRFARHHTTALHSDRVIEQQLTENASLRAAVVLVEKELLRLAEGGG